MTTPPSKIYIGVDPTAGLHPFTYAAVDQDCQLIHLAAGQADDLMEFISHQPSVALAFNAPYQPNLGLVRRKFESVHLTGGHARGLDLRIAEFELREHGILISPTVSRSDGCPAWMQMGFEFYRLLEKSGFQCYSPKRSGNQIIETHPHAAFCAILGKIPLPKPTLEGRLQRQVALFHLGMGIKDPMAFFEEITLHKLLQGTLPMELIYTPEELDALLATLVAYQIFNNADEMLFIGDEREGQIALPVKTLKDKYV